MITTRHNGLPRKLKRTKDPEQTDEASRDAAKYQFYRFIVHSSIFKLENEIEKLNCSAWLTRLDATEDEPEMKMHLIQILLISLKNHRGFHLFTKPPPDDLSELNLRADNTMEMIKDLQEYANMLFVTEEIPQVAQHRRSAAVAADMCSYSAVKTSPYMAQSFYARSDFSIPSWYNPTSIVLPITNVDHNRWELFLTHFNMMSQKKDKEDAVHQNNCEILKIDQVSKEVTISFRWHPLSSLFDVDRPKRSACFLECDQDISNQPHSQQQIDDAAFAVVLKKSFPGFKTLNSKSYRGILMPDPGFVYLMTNVKIIYNKISRTAVDGVTAAKVSQCSKSICVPPKRRPKWQPPSCCSATADDRKPDERKPTADRKREPQVQPDACSRCTKYGDPFPRTIVHLDHRGKPSDSRARCDVADDDDEDDRLSSSSSRACRSPNPFYTSLDQSSRYDWTASSGGEISQDRCRRSRDSIRSCGSNRSEGNSSCPASRRSICDTPRSASRRMAPAVDCDLSRTSCPQPARSPTCPPPIDDDFSNESIAVAARCCRSDENWDPQVPDGYLEFSGENGRRLGDESNFLTSERRRRRRPSLLSSYRSPTRRRGRDSDSSGGGQSFCARYAGHSRSADPSPVASDPRRSATPQGSRRRSSSAVPLPRDAPADRCEFRSGPRQDCRCDGDDDELPRYYYLEDQSMPRTGFDSMESSLNYSYDDDSDGIVCSLRDVSIQNSSFEYEE